MVLRESSHYLSRSAGVEVGCVARCVTETIGCVLSDILATQHVHSHQWNVSTSAEASLQCCAAVIAALGCRAEHAHSTCVALSLVQLKFPGISTPMLPTRCTSGSGRLYSLHVPGCAGARMEAQEKVLKLVNLRLATFTGKAEG